MEQNSVNFNKIPFSERRVEALKLVGHEVEYCSIFTSRLYSGTIIEITDKNEVIILLPDKAKAEKGKSRRKRYIDINHLIVVKDLGKEIHIRKEFEKVVWDCLIVDLNTLKNKIRVCRRMNKRKVFNEDEKEIFEVMKHRAKILADPIKAVNTEACEKAKDRIANDFKKKGVDPFAFTVGWNQCYKYLRSELKNKVLK